MHELGNLEIEHVSGGRPVGFFCSYVLEQNGYDFISSVGIATAVGVACTLSALPVLTRNIVFNAITLNIVTSLSGYLISRLVVNKKI